MGHDSESESPSTVSAIDAVCARFELAWRRDGWPRFADFLAEVESHLQAALLFELVQIDVVYRRQLGQTPSAEEYARWLPHDAQTVSSAFSAATSDPPAPTTPTTTPHRDPDSTITRAGRASSEPAGRAAGTSKVFGNYALLGRVGRGGMGVIYKAQQLNLDRIVAVKMIRTGAYAGPEEIARFRTEAEAAARLQHPHIVGIHEIGEIDGQHFFSMDLVEGTSLAQRLRDTPLAAYDAARYVQQAAEAIHYAHERGVLHRDVKPSNILIDNKDQVKITDFGLAKRVDGGTELTVDAQVLGTPSYMPPEQALGQTKDVDETADIYSLGATLYELLTGRPPFRANTANETLNQVISQEPARPRYLNGSVPQDLENVCLKCLEKERSKRYATASELVDELGRYLRGEPVRARPISYTARSWRWCRRNPVVSVLGAAFAVALAVGVPALVAAKLAATKNSLMQANATEMTELLYKFSEDNRLRQFGLADLRREMMEVTQPYLSKVITASVDSVEARVAKVKAYSMLAYMESEIGNEWTAMKYQESAVALARDLSNDYPGETAHQLLLSEQYHGLGYHSFYLERSVALASGNLELQILEALETELQSQGSFRFRLAACHHNLAVMLLEQYQLGSCELHFRKAMEAFESVTSDDDVVESLVHLSIDRIDLRQNRRLLAANYAVVLRASGKLTEAERRLRLAMKASESVPHPGFYDQFVTGLCLRGMGELQEKFGNMEAARRSYARSIKIFEELWTEYPKERQSWIRSCFFLLWMTEFYVRIGSHDEAVSTFERAQGRYLELGGDRDDFTRKLHVAEHLRQTRFFLAAKFGSLEEAEAAFQQLDLSPARGVYQASRQAATYYEMAAAYQTAGRAREAQEMLAKSETLWTQALESADLSVPDFAFGLAKTRRSLGVNYLDAGDSAQAQRYLADALAELEELCAKHPRVVGYVREQELCQRAIERLKEQNSAAPR